MLTGAEVEKFSRDGILFPCSVLSGYEVGPILEEWLSLEAKHGGSVQPILKAKPHLLVPSLWDLVMDPRIVERVQAILGENLLCFGTSMISKAPADGTHVSWHQDATHWGLRDARAVTAWLALTPSTRENGCVCAIPGTHKSVVPHDHPGDPANLLGRKEVARFEIDPERIVPMLLEEGQLSLHHPLVIHGSEPNRSDSRRIGFAIRYIASDNGQTGGRRGTATLVSGEHYGYYDLEQKPERLMGREAMLRHRDVLRAGINIIFHDSKEPS
ncbi:MAG: phytanoyl-CoA dioxygenase family protein [Gammaproteobacteria bacterium]